MSGASSQVTSNNRTYTISQSIGQSGVTGTSVKNGRVLRQGFQQPVDQNRIRVSQVQKLQARVYPNPSQRWLNILFKEELSSEISLIIYDNMGRLIKKEKHNATSILNIDIVDLATGVYTLKLISGNRQLITTVMKQ